MTFSTKIYAGIPTSERTFGVSAIYFPTMLKSLSTKDLCNYASSALTAPLALASALSLACRGECGGDASGVGAHFVRFVISEWRLLCEICDPEDEKMAQTTKIGQLAAANKSRATTK